MPKKEIDYSNIIIYKIVCKDISITDCYVGHTTNFTKRKYQHKHSCNNENNKDYNMNVYQFIRENGCWDNWDMIEIERFNAIDENDAKKRERFYIEALNARLNKYIPTRTLKEYYQDNKEKILDNVRVYRENNKEQIQEYRENNRDKFKQYREDNKERISEHKKDYYKNNQEMILERQKEYRENNKEMVLEKSKSKYHNNIEKMKEKVNCGCGCEIRKTDISRHKKTKKHLDLISLKSIEKCL